MAQIKIDPLDLPVIGAEEIARLLKLSLRQTYHLLNAGVIDADKTGTGATTRHGRNMSCYVSSAPSAGLLRIKAALAHYGGRIEIGKLR